MENQSAKAEKAIGEGCLESVDRLEREEDLEIQHRMQQVLTTFVISREVCKARVIRDDAQKIYRPPAQVGRCTLKGS